MVRLILKVCFLALPGLLHKMMDYMGRSGVYGPYTRHQQLWKALREVTQDDLELAD